MESGGGWQGAPRGGGETLATVGPATGSPPMRRFFSVGLGFSGLRPIGYGDQLAGGSMAFAQVSLLAVAGRVSFEWAGLADRDKLGWEMWESGKVV